MRKKHLPLPGECWQTIDELTELLLRIHYLKRQQQLSIQTALWVIGPSGAGKSSLIQATRLPFKYTLHSREQNFIARISNDLLFIEVSNRLLEQLSTQAWKQVGQLCKRYPKLFTTNRVLVTLDIRWLSQSAAGCQHFLSQTTQFLQHFSQGYQKTSNVNIVFTQCDLIAGFSEFFSYLTTPQRQQTWGIKSEAAFARLLDDLQQQVLARLQQTQSTRKRRLIKEFPLQLESLRHSCLVCIRTLTKARRAQDDYLITGAYFTSSLQSTYAIDLLANTIPTDYACAALPSAKTTTPKEKDFFIHDLVCPTQEKYRPTAVWRFNFNYLVYAGSACVVTTIIGGFFWLKGHFHDTMDALQTVQSHLQSQTSPQLLNATSNSDLDEMLLQLDQLATLANEQLDNLSSPLIKNATAEQTTDEINKIIQTTLKQRLLPIVIQDLGAQITALKNSNAQMVYHLLKAYLMLGDPQHMDSDYLSGLMGALWQGEVANSQKLALRLKWLQYALDNHEQASALDSQVIRQARSTLNEIPAHTLLTIWLQETNMLEEPLEMAIGKELYWEIPFEYTKRGAIQNLQYTLPQLVNQLTRGDWVIGVLPDIQTISNAELELIADQVAIAYLRDYRTWWQRAITTGLGQKHHDLTGYISWLETLAQHPESLLSLVDPVHEHTSPLQTEGQLSVLFNQHIADHFTDLGNIHLGGVKQLAPFFKNLHSFLQTLSSLPDRSQAALRIAQQRFNQNLENDPFAALFITAELEPEPLRQWLTTITLQGWSFIIQMAEEEIQQQWLAQVYEFYEQSIADRYPITADAIEDINLNDFASFFANRGRFNQFYRHYLTPFIDNRTNEWELKSMDGMSLAIDESTLRMLQLSNIIHSMFFNPISDQFDVAFAIQPIEFNPYLNQLSLMLDGKEITNQSGSNAISEFHWQGQSSDDKAEISMQDANGDIFTQEEQGPWGWLRLLDQEKQTTDDPRLYILTFSHDELPMARYYLSSTDTINPFIPGVIDYFTLPQVVVNTG